MFVVKELNVLLHHDAVTLKALQTTSVQVESRKVTTNLVQLNLKCAWMGSVPILYVEDMT